MTAAAPRPRSVVVFGGTGRTGRLIVGDAVRAGYEVTVAARRPELAGVLPDGVRVVRADVHDSESVSSAVAGHDAAILAISTPANKPGTLYSEAAENVVRAAADTDPMRVIAVSSGGVRRDDPALPLWYRRVLIPLFMSDLYDDMERMEETITATSLDWTIVRASYLRDHTATRRFRVADGATPRRGWKLSRADLAQFVIDQLGSDEWLRRRPTLAE